MAATVDAGTIFSDRYPSYAGAVTDGFNPSGGHSDGADISTALVLTVPAGARKLYIQTTGQNVRYTLDGTTPTASKGFRLIADDPAIVIPVQADTIITVIQEAASPAADLQYQFGV